jgi:hypothetical protein
LVHSGADDRVLHRLGVGRAVELEHELGLAGPPFLRRLGAQVEGRQDGVAARDGRAVEGVQLHRPFVPRALLHRHPVGVGEGLAGHREGREIDLLHVALQLERGDTAGTHQVHARQLGDALLGRRRGGRTWGRRGRPGWGGGRCGGRGGRHDAGIGRKNDRGGENSGETEGSF